MLLRDNETFFLSFIGEVTKVKLQIGPEINSGCLKTGLLRQDWIAGKLKEVVTLYM